MLVYGDHQELAEPKTRAREINRLLDSIGAMPPGIRRHARLVAALDDTGRLLQGIADAEFAAESFDGQSAATDDLSGSLLAIARSVIKSWDTRFTTIGELPRLSPDDGWPSQVEMRVPEGYAFYALYPEAYVEAARRLKLVAPARVIGIRSIGTSLAAVVAATLDAPAPATLRPFGDPAARRVAVEPLLERELLDGHCHYVIVDEGPGQSGSSFAAVAEWLAERGVADERICVIPSHSGAPGATATEARRRWWCDVQREVGDFGHRWPKLIGSWCADLLGPLDEPPRDISAGAWRPLQYRDESEWPAVVPAWERRKYLVRARGEQFLVKFAGLGRVGEEKLAIARPLYSERLVPEPIGIVHGFLVERWCDDAAPLRRSDKPLAEVARYVGMRAPLLPATSDSGASAARLLEMARRNISVEFGDRTAAALDRWSRRTRELDRRIVRVRTDNRLDRQEWLRTTTGALVKTDALDHHQAHDLVGCQDVAWDAAGALIEFDGDQKEEAAFVAAVEHWAGRQIDRELLEFYRVAYLAFRLGQARLGQFMIPDLGEQQRLRRRGDFCAGLIHDLLERTRTATQRES